MADFPPRHPGDIFTHIPHDFPPQESGRGSGGNQGAGPLTDWQRLSRGQALGKSVGIRLISGGGLGTNGTNALQVQGDDGNALPLCILLSPPKITANVTTVNPAQIPSGQGNQVTGFSWASPFARIEWGIGGVSNSCDVDIHQGAMVSLMASFVRVSIFVEDPPLATVTDALYTLSAFIGPGRDKWLGGQRSVAARSIPAVNVETAILEVPNFARRVKLVGALTAAASAFVGNIRFYRDRNSLLPVAEYIFAGNTPDSFPVPNGAYYFTIIPGVAAVDQMTAVFDLAI